MAERKLKYRLAVSVPAQRDLGIAGDWAFSIYQPPAAKKYKTLIKTALKAIEKAPFAPPSKSAENFGSGLRVYHIRWARKGPPNGHHYLFFRVIPPDIVQVVAAPHEAADLHRHLEKAISAIR